MLCDAKSKIPLFLRNVSGNISDKTSFKNLIIDSLDTIKEQFHELEYLVGDSALCTEEILALVNALGSLYRYYYNANTYKNDIKQI